MAKSYEVKNCKSCLYLTYDGLLDPLGRSQIIPYLEQFATKGVRLVVVSFEKAAWLQWNKENPSYRRRLAQQGIQWIPLRYHKWPPVLSTLWDLLQGLVVCTWISRRRCPEIVHARGYVVALLALWVKGFTKARFLFDMRGFWPEERIEGGLSRPDGLLYRCTKWWEKRFLREADGIVVLSHVAKEILEERMKKNGSSVTILVVPTCADLKKFVPRQENSNKKNLTRIVYVGSVGTWYLVEEMVQFFKILQHRIPEAHLSILTPRPDPLLSYAFKDLNPSAHDIQMLTHEGVPPVLQTMHASLCFIKPVNSKKASCPTKVGESLACGVPVVITKDVGDCDRLVERERVGVVVPDFSPRGYGEALERLIALVREGSALSERCRRVAKENFDLERGVEKYLSFYEALFIKGQETREHRVVYEEKTSTGR